MRNSALSSRRFVTNRAEKMIRELEVCYSKFSFNVQYLFTCLDPDYKQRRYIMMYRYGE